MVALVRGVHGLRGAVRVEVLTDRPAERFVPGAVLFREGDEAPLTIGTAEEVVDGPGWRIRFRELTTRDGADTLRGAYLEAVVRPDEDLSRGTYYWHEVIGTTVRGVDGTELGTVQDIYRVGETEVFVVGGGAFGSFDLPAVRAFIRIFAPRRGEIVVDAEALDLKPPRSSTGVARPKAPRRRGKRAPGPAVTADRTDPAQASSQADTADPPRTPSPADTADPAQTSGPADDSPSEPARR